MNITSITLPLAVAKPRVAYKEIDGEKCEPYENLTIDLEDEHQGGVMEEIGRRRGELTNMESDGNGRTRLEYRIPARGLIGFQSDFMTMTRGTGQSSSSTTTNWSSPPKSIRIRKRHLQEHDRKKAAREAV